MRFTEPFCVIVMRMPGLLPAVTEVGAPPPHVSFANHKPKLVFLVRRAPAFTSQSQRTVEPFAFVPIKTSRLSSRPPCRECRVSV